MVKILSLLLFMLAPAAFSQPKIHLPLEAGNAWYFNDASSPSIEVLGDTLLGGELYKVLSNYAMYVGYPNLLFIRLDSNKTYVYNEYAGTEYVAYDFSLPSGTTYHSDGGGNYRMCTGNQLVRFAGRTLRQWSFSHGSSCIDCGADESLVDSIGWTWCSGANYTNRVSKVVLGGKTVFTGVAKVSTSLPDAFAATVHPNPFNTSALVKCVLPREGHLRVTLFNSLGQRVRTLFDNRSPGGEIQLTLDGAGLSSGLYFCQFAFDGVSKVSRVVLMK